MMMGSSLPSAISFQLSAKSSGFADHKTQADG
jgi:hypothetical protein